MKGHTGKFTPTHPEKYQGDAKNIWYRSSWELAFMSRLDTDPRVLAWASEELIIPYADRVSGRVRRYFPDFLIKRIGRDGEVRTIVIEIKPYNQSVPPIRGKKTERRFLSEVKTFANNFSKWEHAKAYCAKKGWEFIVLTEKNFNF